MKKLIYGIALALLCTGCSDFLSEYSQSQTVARNVAHFDEVLLGDGYIPSVALRYISTDFAGFLNVLDDDVTTVGGGTAGLQWPYMMTSLYGYYAWQFEVGRTPAADVVRDDSQTWRELYRRINVVNVILHEIEDIKTSSAAEELDKTRVCGECHFIRGQMYFMLVNLYGNAYNKGTANSDLGVPLKTTYYIEHDKDKDTQFNRATVAEVYAQSVSDLRTAVDLLTKSPQRHPLHRASRESSLLLLSRVYLYMQDWDNARETAAALLAENSELYRMSSRNAESVFLTENNPEVLFSQGPLNLQNSMKGERADFAVSDELLSLFGANDYRRYFFDLHEATSTNVLARKYNSGAALVSHISDIYTLRVSEGYLNMAEACAMLDKTEEANRYLRLLRESRIGSYVHTNLAGSQLIEDIRLERRRELCFEGHRWFDLRRYAVCEKYPFSKQITHKFNVYEGGNYKWDRTDIYVLDKRDAAYTFQIPKAVLEYDRVPMPENPRNVRPAVGED